MKKSMIPSKTPTGKVKMAAMQMSAGAISQTAREDHKPTLRGTKRTLKLCLKLLAMHLTSIRNFDNLAQRGL